MNEKVMEALKFFAADPNPPSRDYVATIRAYIEGLEAARDAGADLDCDERRDDADFWWNVAAFRAVELGRQLERAEAAEARVRELEADAARYRWLRTAEAGACERPYIGYRNGHGFSHFIGHYADAAIDAAMQENRDGR